jgi:hypothetical protein
MGKLILDEILARLATLETAVLGRPRRRLPKSEVARQEGYTPRHLMRKVKDRTFPPPDEVINGRLSWWTDTIERHRERPQADTPAARAARNPGLRPRKPTQTSPET